MLSDVLQMLIFCAEYMFEIFEVLYIEINICQKSRIDKTSNTSIMWIIYNDHFI